MPQGNPPSSAYRGSQHRTWAEVGRGRWSAPNFAGIVGVEHRELQGEFTKEGPRKQKLKDVMARHPGFQYEPCSPTCRETQSRRCSAATGATVVLRHLRPPNLAQAPRTRPPGNQAGPLRAGPGRQKGGPGGRRFGNVRSRRLTGSPKTRKIGAVRIPTGRGASWGTDPRPNVFRFGETPCLNGGPHVGEIHKDRRALPRWMVRRPPGTCTGSITDFAGRMEIEFWPNGQGDGGRWDRPWPSCGLVKRPERHSRPRPGRFRLHPT